MVLMVILLDICQMVQELVLDRFLKSGDAAARFFLMLGAQMKPHIKIHFSGIKGKL